MKIGKLIGGLAPFIKRNSSTILTGLGVAGSLGSVILAVRATPAATHKLDQAYVDKNAKNIVEHGDDAEVVSLTFIEVIKIAWLDYLPVAVLEGVTVAAIIGAQSINLRRQAAILSAFTISETALREYTERMAVEAPTKDRKVRDDIARQHIEDNPIAGGQVVIIGKGEQLFFDPITGRYFMSDMETIRKAVNDINFRVLNQNYAAQNEFYSMVGLPNVELGDELGWTPEHEFRVDFSSQITDDGRPAIVIDYLQMPLKNYWKGFV